MTVKQLIAKLQKLDCNPDTEVYMHAFEYDTEYCYHITETPIRSVIDFDDIVILNYIEDKEYKL